MRGRTRVHAEPTRHQQLASNTRNQGTSVRGEAGSDSRLDGVPAGVLPLLSPSMDAPRSPRAPLLMRLAEGVSREDVRAADQFPSTLEAAMRMAGHLGAWLHPGELPRGGGEPLPRSAERLEDSLGMDLGRVRLHRGPDAQRAATAFNARAFTVGEDIFLGRHAPPLESADGQKMLAHEVAHVAQGYEQRVPSMASAGRQVSRPEDALEQEAEAFGARAVAGTMGTETTGSRVLATPPSPARAGLVQRTILNGAGVPYPTLAALFTDLGPALMPTVGVFDRNLFMAVMESEEVQLRVGDYANLPALLDAVRAAYQRLTADWDDGGAAMMTDQAEEEPEEEEAEMRFEQGDASMTDAVPAPLQGAGGAGVTTALTTHFSLAPVQPAQGQSSLSEPLFRMDQLRVSSLALGNQDRPDTRYGDAQESHTVAWTLVRAAELARSGLSVADVVESYRQDFEHLYEASPLLRKAAPPEFFAGLAGAAQPAAFWQRLLGRLSVLYIQAYQSSESATYRRGAALGHGEAHAMRLLALNDAALEQGQPTTVSVGELRKRAETLLDVRFAPSLSPEAYAAAVQHWVELLTRAFPNLMRALGPQLTEGVLGKQLPAGKKADYEVDTVEQFLQTQGHRGVGSSSGPWAPAARQFPAAAAAAAATEPAPARGPSDGDFVAQVSVVPAEHAAAPTSSAMAPGFGEAEVESRWVDVSDRDRPPTQFDTQMSHTVAWTLLRQALMGHAGRPLSALLDFLERQLAGLQGDLASAEAEARRDRALQWLRQRRQERLQPDAWSHVASVLVREFTVLYQLASSSTFADAKTHGRAVGHGEAQHMAVLRRNEQSIQGVSRKLVDPPDRVAGAAVALFDPPPARTDAETQRLVHAVVHWVEFLRAGFPNLSAAGLAMMLEPVLSRALESGAGTVGDAVEAAKPGFLPRRPGGGGGSSSSSS